MVDAVTGVMIIALTAAVVLTSLGLVRAYRQRAEADREAASAFSYLLTSLPRTPGRHTGSLNGFAYRADVITEVVQGQPYCRLDMSLSRDRPEKTYRLSGLRPCSKGRS